MGNKPSLEKAFDTANQVFNEYQRTQKQQEQAHNNNQYPGNHQGQPYGQHQQQQQHYNPPNQQQYGRPPNQQHNNHQGYPHSPSPHPDEDDDPEYTRLRGLAHQEALARNDCYERSHQAYNNGNGAEGTREHN
jgi:hypothetical protein